MSCAISQKAVYDVIRKSVAIKNYCVVNNFKLLNYIIFTFIVVLINREVELRL